MTKNAERVLDQFLAAPDTLRRSAAERGKALARKAREEAERRRLLSKKLKTPPSVEDLIEDLNRVATDEATNPFAKFKSVSRRRYELYGHYPIAVADARFGTFQHFKEVAGLADQPGDRLWRANRARESKRAHAQRYLERWVAPYVAKRDGAKVPEQGYDLLSISDTHSQFLCPFTWIAFLAAIKHLRPAGVLFNGDTLETVELSRHPKIPGWTEPLQSELDFKREMFRQVREVAGHDGDVWDTGGNHDLVDRLCAYLTQVAPALVKLRDLRVDRLMGLQDYGVKLFHGGSILSPEGTEDAKPGFLLFDHYRIHHGTMLGGDPAAKELRAAGRSGQSGHVHRASLAYGTTERDEGLSWMTTPMGARHEVGRSYIKGTNTGWQRGFGYARIFPDGSVHQYPVVVSGTPERATVEGYTFWRPRGLRDPRPHGQWLRDLNFSLDRAPRKR